MLKWFKASRWRILLGIGIIIVLILVLLLGGVYLLLDSAINKTEQLDVTVPTLSYEEEVSEVGALEEQELDPIFERAEDIFKGKDIVNILLVGQDRREGQKRQRSDTMIMCTIDRATKTLTFTSFLRDIWVYIPDKYNQRLNVPYILGGFPLLNETLQYNFGIQPDYNVEIDFYGFQDAIDLLGGVDVELTAEEAKYLNKISPAFTENHTYWNLKTGLNHLDGNQTLQYARIRKLDSDFGRTKRQRTVLENLTQKIKDLDPMELYNLASSILPMLSTDLKTSHVAGMILDVLPMLSDIKIVSQQIPLKGEYSYGSKKGASVIILSEKNLDKAKELLTETMKEAE